ncbi:MAG: TRAP transporter small permease subunit [Gammaproteobacteria bacterium]|jgi:TRAP-type mannitol/chloroaromatic compound transport system permease small subunit|nr:TRAP transporter small permease subunit [Gammaproteobacteria bacterium]MBT5154768.1 TRAP transporter small permease subunit [Gammaproteobacteria bacterium]MBT5684343.1 TRAP transporter small permease subunit [Gammaproteobacteria bacterium]MBT6889938.1 TRAP transporter small permease subunit [Gammaproteobacteria bacterium]MBT7877767.1 TRAP transporter small permease subunit [Gammaproteobacteria bacterium]
MTGKAIAWLTLVMVVITCVVVAARYLFNFGSIGLQESVMYMHGTVFMLGIAFTLKEQGHVRVDVLYEKFPPRVKIYIDIAGHLLFLIPFSIFILWTSVEYVSFSWSLRESSGQPGGLPAVYLVKGLIPTMAILLLLQGISEILKGVLLLTPRPGK